MDENKNSDSSVEAVKIKSKQNESFWRYFWITIGILLILVVAAFSLANYKRESDRLAKEYTAKKLQETKKQMLAMTLSIKSDIEKTINEEVQKVYSPVYSKGIEQFASFHYSIKGEYVELIAGAKDGIRHYAKMTKKSNFDKLIYKFLFQSVDFDKNYMRALANINSSAINIIDQHVKHTQKNIKNKLGINDYQLKMLTEQLHLASIVDMKKRFGNKLGSSLRINGLKTFSVQGTVFAKKIVPLFLKKLGTKLAVKGGSKITWTAVGGVIGVGGGLFGGPIVSAVGGIVGAIVGWFAVDAIVVDVDRYFNSGDFKNKLTTLIREQELETVKQLNQSYMQVIDEFYINHPKDNRTKI